MKKNKFILGVVAAVSVIVAMTGCDLSIREKYVPQDAAPMVVSLASDGCTSYDIDSITLNGTELLTSSVTMSSSFINNVFAAAVSESCVETEGGDFTIVYTCSNVVGHQSTSIWGPWNVVMRDTTNQGTYDWVARVDAFGYDPMPSYPVVDYGTGLSDPLAFDDGFIVKVVGTIDTVTITAYAAADPDTALRTITASASN